VTVSHQGTKEDFSCTETRETLVPHIILEGTTSVMNRAWLEEINNAISALYQIEAGFTELVVASSVGTDLARGLWSVN
jgi:hypothetical protein